jgi:hypothetical protein
MEAGKKLEEELLNNESKLSWMSNLLQQYQFSEDFLIKTRIYYDSWKCLRTQKNLSPYFCFYYLYDRQEYDSADDWTDFNQVKKYLEKRFTDEEINKVYIQVMDDREREEREEREEIEEREEREE